MMEANNMQAALSYAGIGLHILPCWWVRADKTCACGNAECASPGKHPIGKLAPKGQDNATTDPAVIAAWWDRYPHANIAAYLQPSNLCAVDIDPRNNGHITIADLEAAHGPVVSDLVQFTGGGGEHRVFKAPGVPLPGKLGKGIDLKANGYIMLEPSNHISGVQYAWEASSDPRDGIEASPLPAWICELAKAVAAPATTATACATTVIDAATVRDLRSALNHLLADDREQWVSVGLALKELGDVGRGLWLNWSQTSDKFQPSDARTWDTFKPAKTGHAAVFARAQAAGWVNPAKTVKEVPAPANDWPTLDALAEEKAPTPYAFPFHAMGPILGSAARAIAEDVQAPDSLAGGSVLAAASLAVQALANAMLPHGQRSPLSVFVITGAGSGDRKSAVDKVACKEVEEVRENQARAHAKEMIQYEAEMGERKPKDATPAKPAPQSITTGNATIEGICKLLKFQSHVGIFSAEGGEMLGGHSLRDDKRSSGLAFYLKGWSGESLDSLRGGDGLTVLLGRRIAMHVLVQPVLLGQLLCDPLAQGQGLLARCLIAQPDTLAGHRPYRNVNPHENPAVVAYNERMRTLLEITPERWLNGDGYELKPRDLYLDTDARALWIAFYNEIERQQANGSELEGARPFASKAAEHAARIAGIITMVENPQATAIASQAMDGAIQLTAFYLNEHLRLTGAGRQERQASVLRTLLEWLQERGTTVAKKDVLQRTPRAIRNLKAAGINALLSDLVQRGYIRDASETWEIRHV